MTIILCLVVFAWWLLAWSLCRIAAKADRGMLERAMWEDHKKDKQ